MSDLQKMVSVNEEQVELGQIKVLEEGCDGDNDSEEGSSDNVREAKGGGNGGEG